MIRISVWGFLILDSAQIAHAPGKHNASWFRGCALRLVRFLASDSARVHGAKIQRAMDTHSAYRVMSFSAIPASVAGTILPLPSTILNVRTAKKRGISARLLHPVTARHEKVKAKFKCDTPNAAFLGRSAWKPGQSGASAKPARQNAREKAVAFAVGTHQNENA
jgi:hypothetical protein